MDNFRNAVKAFIVEDSKLLLIKRRPNDAHQPGLWDNPGGRLEVGENPFTGLERETKEEIACDIEILIPLDVHFFTRDDGQKIQLIVFVCKLKSKNIQLSKEHTEYEWKNMNDPIHEFPQAFQCCVEKFKKLEFKNFL